MKKILLVLISFSLNLLGDGEERKPASTPPTTTTDSTAFGGQDVDQNCDQSAAVSTDATTASDAVEGQAEIVPASTDTKPGNKAN